MTPQSKPKELAAMKQPDTPRTDLEASNGWSGGSVCVGAEFSRQLERELTDLKERHQQYKRRIASIVFDNLAEVTNEIGGVIGYKLNLNSNETEHLCRELDRD